MDAPPASDDKVVQEYGRVNAVHRLVNVVPSVGIEHRGASRDDPSVGAAHARQG